MPDSLDLVPAAEAAAMLAVSVATVSRWAVSGRLPTAFQAPGDKGARLFLRSDVTRLAGELATEAEDRLASLRRAAS